MAPDRGLGDRAGSFAVFAGFTLLACAVTWPLPIHLRTHLLGNPTGDTGVYVWNLWIFRHEWLRHGHLPFSTEHIFSFTGGTDFALHNYAPVAGLLGVPLMAFLGLVGTFNVLMIAAIACSGWGVFALARHLGLGRVAACAAGAIFIATPTLMARQTAHFSLVIAAPLPLFLWALLRTLETLRIRYAVLVGVLCAVATYCDAYYGVYCMLMGAVVVACHFVRVETSRSLSRFSRYGLDLAIGLLVLMIVWRALNGPTDLRLGALRIGLQTLYTPMLALVSLLLARLWLTRRPRIRLYDPDARLRTLTQLAGLAVVVCLTLLTPLIVGIAVRFWNNRLPATEIYWRSSPRGVDLLAYLVPNPHHPLFGEATRGWLLPADKLDAYPEFVGSFSIIAACVIAVAAWRRTLPRQWVGFTLFFIALSLGPFVYIAGFNTYVPGPWALFRYLPIVGMARSPSRFAIVGAMGLSLLFGFAVQSWLQARPTALVARRGAMGLVAAALIFELLAIPRPLYSAAVPDVYKLIATTDDETGRLLELPTGVRDGTLSSGDFEASSQYFQTTHHRQLIGGYLSRVSGWRRRENLRSPVLRALFALGERRELSAAWRNEAIASRDAFIARSCIRYVIVNKRRATKALRTFAVETLRLTSIHEDEEYELLTPVDPPPCSVTHRTD